VPVEGGSGRPGTGRDGEHDDVAAIAGISADQEAPGLRFLRGQADRGEKKRQARQKRRASASHRCTTQDRDRAFIFGDAVGDHPAEEAVLCGVLHGVKPSTA
jgi:hypothetical protein